MLCTCLKLEDPVHQKDSDQSQVIFHQQLLSLNTIVPIPSIKIHILPSKCQRPIPAIGLIDTGAQRSMLNLNILPSEYWTKYKENFRAVNGKLFTTSLITTKPIGIQIFPNCVIWTKVIGSTLPNKDILLGFDILHQIKHLQIIPTGIRVKSMFKPFTDILKLYNLSETPQSYQDISTKLLNFCPESHSEFTHPNPLWKNKSFFIKLPFKLNEDINPTKATHPGMSPSDLLLAQKECSQLLAQGLIEPTNSQWACHAFYVEKHSEIVRGKKCLVIDYQPLNMFLQDDKFPLPRRQSMFTFLKNAQIFSKFDLKSGFWQLGIEPSERYKTAFCIPNAHFQWTVLPFGLKTAPSIFQKSMVKLFQPILHHALIYIDDILLFSGSHDEHRQLLTQLYDIVQSHGIMLSAKKSTIATDNIEFLGMIIKDGHYQPGKHITQELFHFPDQHLSKKQVQQFLGIINYIRDFIPHVDHYTHHLSALLKKKPPEWNADHTIAVTTLNQIAQNSPPLKLITDGKCILQTDASDESWGAILLEEINGKEHFIAHASGQFSDTQKHYHSVFKEILAVKNGIKKFEYHLIGHHFLIRMDSSTFPNILTFKGKTVPEKMLLRLKDCFSKYDFSVKHIKGSQNLIPDMLSRLSKPENPLTLFSTAYHFPIISMATSLPPEALTKKTFPFNKNFSSVFAIQEFARKAVFRFFMKAYLVTDSFPFSTFHPENLFLTGLNLDPSREITEDELWYIWCLTALYATKLILPIAPTLETLLNPDKATSLTWTLLEWFSPIPWWRKKLQQLSAIYDLERMPVPEAQMFTTIFIIHRPYFQHPDTNLFWTQDQVYEWFTAPHPAVVDNEIQSTLHNYLCQLNHQTPPHKDIFHTSLGPQHDLIMIPTPSAIVHSQHLQQFPQLSMNEPGSSSQPPQADTATKPSKVDKATQTSPRPGYQRDCLYPPCRGPHYFRRRETFSFVASTSSSTLSTPVTLSSTLSLPKSCSSHTTNKIENLVEYSYIPESAQISESSYPPLSPYHLYKRPSSFTRSIRTLISTRRPHPKEYIPTIIQILRQIPRHELIKLMPLEWISNYEQFHTNTAPIQLQDDKMAQQLRKICPLQGLILKATLFIQPNTMAISYGMSPAQVCVTPFVPAGMIGKKTTTILLFLLPPLEPHIDSHRNVVSKPFIPSPITSTGHLEPPKPFESVLNWQTQNARAQNDTLLQLNSKVEKINFQTDQIETKVDSIVAQMQQIHQNLQSRIGQLDSELRAMLPTGPTYHPFASMLSPIRQYDPSKLFGMTHTLFRDNPLPPTPKPKPKSKPQPQPVTYHQSSISIPGHQSFDSTPAPASPSVPPPTISQPPTQSTDKEPMHLFTAHTITHSSTINDQTSDSNLVVSDSHTKSDTESSASTSDSEKSFVDITKILMAQPDQPTQGQTSHTEPYVDIPSEVEEEMPESSATNQPSPTQAPTNPSSQKSSNGPWFTFDDLPSHKWRDRLNEMSAWIDLQMLRPGATTQSVLREFATRFTGALRDWFDSLGQYRQLQFVDLPEVSSALAVLHDQFLSDPSAVFEAARRDYLNMKYCSLNAKDLDFHYKRMSLLFYKLNGFNEPTLKHVFLASLPDELQPDIQRQLTVSNLALDNISLGKIFQLAKTCLDKLCEHKQFFKELLKDKEPFRSACKKPYLQIKCKKKKDCDCSPKKKRHVQKFKTPDFSSRRHRSRKPYRFFLKKSSSSREFKRKH
ncbi:hypothetical protein KPL71_023860 [Citrus sinensis]|uniref:Uncharacterized protein n=1 Tax=Citrus sinensis TaxID=2711 RepID=A0ACB8IMA9_CITSI|nr:hypothetical protein KPL71_023860 [Citrus sinensis]